MGIEEIKNTLEKQIMLLNDQEKKLDILNNCFKEYYAKDVDHLVKICEYRIGNLKNAHAYSSVANQIEVQKDTDELNNAIDNLRVEMEDLESIKKDLTDPLGVDSYDELSNDLVKIIDNDLNLGGQTLDRAQAILNHDFEVFKNSEENNYSEDKVVDIEEAPTQIVTDSLEDLAKGLEDELNNAKETKAELEEAKEEYAPVEEAVLPPVEETNLDDSVSEYSEDITPIQESNEFPSEDIKEDSVDEIESAQNVDEGFVHVDNVEDFTKEEENEVEEKKGKGRKKAA